MNPSNKTYAQKLVKAAISGASKPETPVNQECAADVILKSLTAAVVGSWIDTQIFRRRARLSRTAAYAALGFIAALAWNTRATTGAMARSAAREIGKVRDEHWLELNPIDYA